MIKTLSLKPSGMNHMAEALESMAINRLEGAGKEESVRTVVLYIKDWVDSRELSLENGDEWVEVLWVNLGPSQQR